MERNRMTKQKIAEITASGSFEGTPKDVAYHIFSTLIVPIAEQLKKWNLMIPKILHITLWV
jgi:hypothetical protein